MDFLIRKNSTSPYIVMKVIHDSDTDADVINKKIEDAAVTFSMVNLETGKYKVANRAGAIYTRENPIDCPTNPLEHFVYYKWREKDVNEEGIFRAEFKLNFIEDCEAVILPIDEELFVHVKDSITKSTILNI